MFTNRISKIFVVLFVLAAALATVSFATRSANVFAADRSYDSVEQARIASVQADRSYDSIELLRNDRHKLILSKPSAKTAPEIVTGQSSAANGSKQLASLSVGPGDELEYCTYTSPGQRICRR